MIYYITKEITITLAKLLLKKHYLEKYLQIVYLQVLKMY